MKSREALIVDALSAVLRVLDGVGTTARSRELRVQARFYEQAARRWTVVPPTKAALDAMFDLVTDLHSNAIAREPRGPT